MELGKILEFRKDLYFEGAVQADWFYSPDKAAKVAENFVFHGKQYFGLEEQNTGINKRIDTISLVEELVSKLNDDRSNALSLAIADYGTGKSHLAVTLAQIFSGPDYMKDTYNKVLDNIKKIDENAANKIADLSGGRNFVMVLNGMRDFNLHSEVLKAAQKSLKLYGLPDDNLKKLNRAIETAQIFFERNAINSISLFENAAEKYGWIERGDSLVTRIRENLMTEEVAFEIVNTVYENINGQEIRWDEGLSASSILEMLVSDYCGMNGMFDNVILLFDEFGRYLEYTAGVSAAKSGESGLQQIFELTQNSQGNLHVINFIQRDIKAYLETVDQTKNISRYIGRYDQSEKYRISSNLETVFANLIQRKDKDAFTNLIVKWQNNHEQEWQKLFQNMNRWLVTKGMWKDYKLFRKVAVEGIYPMHPLATYMLCNLSDYLQNRSSLTLISNYIAESENEDIDSNPLLIMPERLIAGDLYTEMLAAEQEGRQKTQQCIKFDNAIRKFGDKLSENSIKVLRSNLILRILRFRTNDYEDIISAMSTCCGLSIDEIKTELRWLEDEYAILEYDDVAHVFDFTEESNGAHDFKIIKKRLIANANVSRSIITSAKIQELAGVLEPQTTNFGIQHKITTSEWQFIQELYPIEDFSAIKVKNCIDEWKAATGSTTPKGRIIWLYANRDSSADAFDTVNTLVKNFAGMPIIVMLLNDTENRLFDRLVEYSVLDSMDDTIRKKYSRHYDEDFTRAESNLKDEIDTLKKQRTYFSDSSVETLTSRMPIYLTSVFEKIYPNAVPFFFDGFVTKGNNVGKKAAGFYCSFLKMLLSNTVNEATIHNFVIDMRNRVEALFSVTAQTSWKCISEKCKIMPPQEKHAENVYNWIVDRINNEQELACKEIYETLCMPPYGLSEEIVTLMIAVVCSNLSYCLRVRYQGMKNINIWKDDVVTNNDQKVDLKVVKESVLVFVDAGAVTGKYMRFFDKIKNNTNIQEVNRLSSQLEEMIQVDEVPEELEQAYLLAVKTLDSGKKAKNEWNDVLSQVDEKLEAAEDSNNPYNALVALQLLENIPVNRIFNDNGYEFDEESKADIKSRNDEITHFIKSIMEYYISNMYCDKVEKINTFRNHNTKVENLLSELGFVKFAELVRRRKESELGNIEEIRSRQELRADLDKYLQDSKMDKFTSYVNVCALLKDGEKIQERAAKYSNALGRDSEQLVKSLTNRIEELTKYKNRINQDMTDIWDDLVDVKNADDVEDLLERIAIILQKGISSADQIDFSELQSNLQELLDDVNEVKEATQSRKQFEEKSRVVLEKYKESDFDFEVEPIIEEVINDIKAKLDQKEENWKNKYLTLGDKSRNSVHRWMDNTNVLPEYLSEETIELVRKLKNEADQIISDGKIEDVLFYFDKLSTNEKIDCLEKLKRQVE